MKQIDEVLRRVDEGIATSDEMRMADEYLNGLERKLSSRIDTWEADGQSYHKARLVWLRHAVAVAACLLVIFSVTLWMERREETPVVAEMEKDTYNNPEEAAAEAERALVKFSVAINKAVCYNQ